MGSTFWEPSARHSSASYKCFARRNWLVADATGTYYYLINPCKTLHYDHNMPEGNGVCFSDSRACQLSTDRTPLTLVAKNFSSGTLAESGMAILLTGGTICSAYNNKPREAIITLTCSSNIVRARLRSPEAVLTRTR